MNDIDPLDDLILPFSGSEIVGDDFGVGISGLAINDGCMDVVLPKLPKVIKEKIITAKTYVHLTIPR